MQADAGQEQPGLCDYRVTLHVLEWSHSHGGFIQYVVYWLPLDLVNETRAVSSRVYQARRIGT